MSPHPPDIKPSKCYVGKYPLIDTSYVSSQGKVWIASFHTQYMPIGSLMELQFYFTYIETRGKKEKKKQGQVNI